MKNKLPRLVIVGGGLAGSEAAWQAAERAVHVDLYEMRPEIQTGAHRTAQLAELICSNSLGSNLVNRPSGLLKEELRRLGSLLLQCADAASLPAGGALAVDREKFASAVTERIGSHPHINLLREEVKTIPAGNCILASGPLTSPALSESIQSLTGSENLFFFDAIAPVITGESINMDIAYRGSRFEVGQDDTGDYINCPMQKDEYERFIDALLSAERIPLREFDEQVRSGVKAGRGKFFEGCLPIEVMAQRGRQSLSYGPMRPIGLRDPRTGAHAYAVLQLRQDNLAGDLYNLVGFQTNLTYPEQQRVFRMIPGLEHAEYARFGEMHRNTFLFSPGLLDETLQMKSRPGCFIAGQLTGVEGYVGNIATGLVAGINAARHLYGRELLVLPPASMLGSLLHYITHADERDYQPTKANFGILPPLENPPKTRRMRAESLSQRALKDIQSFLVENKP